MEELGHRRDRTAGRRPRTRMSPEAQRDELIHEVEALVPQALIALEQAGWPGGVPFRVRGALRAKAIPGWPAGGYRFHAIRGGPDRVTPLYLLRDGRWMYGHRPDPATFAQIVRDMGDGAGPHPLRAGALPEGVTEDLRRLAGT